MCWTDADDSYGTGLEETENSLLLSPSVLFLSLLPLKCFTRTFSFPGPSLPRLCLLVPPPIYTSVVDVSSLYGNLLGRIRTR